MFLMGDQTSVENGDRHVSADHDPDLRLVWILALSLATTRVNERHDFVKQDTAQ